MPSNESKQHSSLAFQGEPLTIPLAHLPLSAIRYGHDDKPIILACHGWLDNLQSFVPLAEAFLQSELALHFQLITFDWPGHGLSAHRQGCYPLHWVDYLYDLDAVVNYFIPDPNQKIILLGHSLGGIVASAYNASFPERVAQLILIEALSPLFEDANLNSARLKRCFKQHRGLFNKPESNKPRGYASVDVVVKARQQLTGMDEKWCRLISSRNLVFIDGLYYWRSDPRLKLDSAYRMTFAQVDALMNQSETQTLLVLGHAGFKQLKLAKQQASIWFKRLQLAEIDGDHHLHMSNAGELINLIRAFILK
ncbi:alpha/beta hydrolase [Shewanella holmiensis]|uniref:Alpha/beta hydrolase n=1 Tax=Shewanella holmiensis TaxID=2952222 RepID=A0A9X2WJB5_9GAMM|nr:alpha/beta hydrolase [Shewanella holmiensis]MCT7940298.1 alpha/beta hydrolase [Shewanella holmiensis]